MAIKSSLFFSTHTRNLSRSRSYASMEFLAKPFSTRKYKRYSWIRLRFVKFVTDMSQISPSQKFQRFRLLHVQKGTGHDIRCHNCIKKNQALCWQRSRDETIRIQIGNRTASGVDRWWLHRRPD